jgi:hypothetical protein
MADALTRWVNSLTAAAPKSREMRELLRQHDKWLATAELNRPYWGPGAFYQWLGDPHSPSLYRHEYVIFNKRGRDRLYASGPNTFSTDSLALWTNWHGITTNEPAIPTPPRNFFITGDLRHYAHPETWDYKLTSH